MSNTAPVEKAQSSEASHATIAATSSTITKRPFGIFDIMKSIWACVIWLKRAVLAAAGVTNLLVEQVAFMALKIADHGYVLQNGRIALSGPAPDLLRDPKLIERYLG